MKKYLVFILPIIFIQCTHRISTQCITDQIDQELAAGKPVLKIGDRTIYEGQIDALSEVTPGFKAGWEDPEKKQEIVNALIEQELFLQGAQENNLLANNKRLQKNLWLQIRNYQAGTYLLQKVDEKARQQYEKDKDRLYSQVEIKDIVILYNQNRTEPTEAEKTAALAKAKQIHQKLNSKNFSEMAEKETNNPIAKANGGNIGTVSKIDQRIRFMGWEPLVDQAFVLKIDQISKPIPTTEGVHIIQVASEKQIQTFEDVLPFIRTQIEQEVKKETLEQMLKQKKIEYLDPTLDPTPK